MDRFNQQDEWEREEEETRRAIFANEEARGIVDPLLARWKEFTTLPPEPENLNAVLFEVLSGVDARLGDGTPRERIPAIAEGIFREVLNRLERRRKRA
jgi:hypothetical protein